MTEPFSYQETLTTILRKLKHRYSDFSFKASIEIEFYGHILSDARYIIWDDKTNNNAIASSLEEAYEIKRKQIIKLKRMNTIRRNKKNV